jgi:AAA domain
MSGFRPTKELREEVERERQAEAEARKRTEHDANGGGNEPKPKQGLRIPIVAFDDIKLNTRRRDLVKGLIPREGLTVIWGPPKCGKSFWTFDVMMRVALNWKYRGRRVHPGPVVYCAFEGQGGMPDRCEAFRQRFLAADHEAVPLFLVFVTLNLVRDHKLLIVEIKHRLDKQKPVAVALDTLNRSLSGSESSDEDMTAYLTAADAIRAAFGCAVVIIHHCGVNETRPRGHTSLTGTADAQLSVKRDAANNVIVKVEYMKDGPEGETIASELKEVPVGTNEDGDPITSCVVVEAEAPVHKTAPKLPATAKAGLRKLHDCLAEMGQPAPPGDRIPAGALTVTLEQWRHMLRVTGIINPDGNEREQFRRIRVTLSNPGAIGIWAPHVWAVT